MSALPLKAAAIVAGCRGSYGPKADIGSASFTPSLYMPALISVCTAAAFAASFCASAAALLIHCWRDWSILLHGLVRGVDGRL